jgi:divalent metal cation (Fe/Co/Zn/Cd) transporter
LLDRYRIEGIDFRALRTRESGRQRFVYVHVLVPDDWTVKHGHEAAERFEADLAALRQVSSPSPTSNPEDDPAFYGHEQLHPPVPPLDAPVP